MRGRLAAGVLAASLLTVILLAGGPYAGTVHACSCAVTSDVASAYRDADAVFAGEMVRGGLEDPDPTDGTVIGGIEFRVIDAWKGVTGESVVLYGQDPAYYGESETNRMVVISSCAYVFEKGERYLVYAHRYKDGFQTDICSKTVSLENAAKDLQALGAPVDRLSDTGGPPPLLLVLVFGCVSVAAGTVLLGRALRGSRR